MKERNCCNQCSKSFAKQSKLNRHLNEVHLKLKNWECHLCGSKFSRKSHLLRHTFSHGFKNRPFKCESCSLSFALKHHLKRHERLIHLGIQYQCNECDFSTLKKFALEKHCFSIHNWKKPFPCDFKGCQKSFFSEGNLRLHEESNHIQSQTQENKEKNILSNSIPVPFENVETATNDESQRENIFLQEKTKNPRKLFVCDLCLRNYSSVSLFIQKFNLKTHFRTRHLNEKNFVCDKCGKCFSHKHTLISHQKKFHFDSLFESK